MYNVVILNTIIIIVLYVPRGFISVYLSVVNNNCRVRHRGRQQSPDSDNQLEFNAAYQYTPTRRTPIVANITGAAPANLDTSHCSCDIGLVQNPAYQQPTGINTATEPPKTESVIYSTYDTLNNK